MYVEHGCPSLWQYGLSSFQAGGTKLERFLPKNQHTPGPRLMRIHLVRNSTSANFGKTPKIFT